MAKLQISSTPHIHQKGSYTSKIMLDVAIALLPFGADVGDRLKFEDFEFTTV